MSFNDHKLIDNSLGDTMLDILEEKRKGDFKMYGTTLVNLLGSYGNFEVDSNSDGLADGWSKSAGAASIVTGIIDSYAQKLQVTASSITCYFGRTINLIADHVYAFIGYKKTTMDVAGTEATLCRIDLYATGYSTVVLEQGENTSNVWKSFCSKITAHSTYSPLFMAYACQSTETSAANKEITLDGVRIIDLTERGALDPVRAAKYGVSNWEDLTEAQLEAEIPYFDSVMSVNVEDGTASELTVENRGKNLMPFYTEENYNMFIQAIGYESVWEGNKLKVVAGWGSAGTFGFLLNLKVGQTYHLSFEYENAGDGVVAMCMIGTLADLTKYTPGYSSGDRIFTVTDNLPVYFRFGRNGPRSLTYPVYFWDIQLEEGSVATDYVPPRTDSITIPDTCELHALEGRHDYVEYDADEEKLLYVSFIAREDKTTDGSGDFALTGAVSGSRVLIRNKTTGAVEWCTESESSVHTSIISSDVEIWYIRATPTSTAIYGLYSGNFLKALKNNIAIDSNLPVAMEINDSNQSGNLITQNFME